MISRIYTKTQDGTGAAISFNCGFKPRYIKVVNVEGLATLEYIDTMAAAKGYKIITAGTNSYIASAGITITDMGFTLGADTDVNVSGEELHVFAI